MSAQELLQPIVWAWPDSHSQNRPPCEEVQGGRDPVSDPVVLAASWETFQSINSNILDALSYRFMVLIPSLPLQVRKVHFFFFLLVIKKKSKGNG